jgi:hypothetical protein
MPEREVCSPVSRPGSKVGSGQPLSPGVRSNPSRGRSDSLAQQPSHARVSRNAEEPAELRIHGPAAGFMGRWTKIAEAGKSRGCGSERARYERGAAAARAD